MKTVRAITRMLFIALSARTLILMPLGGFYASGANLPQNLLRVAQVIYQRKTQMTQNAKKGRTQYDKLSQTLHAAGQRHRLH